MSYQLSIVGFIGLFLIAIASPFLMSINVSFLMNFLHSKIGIAGVGTTAVLLFALFWQEV